MKTIIEEAIDAFQSVHNDRCLPKTKCEHKDLIDRAKSYERTIQKNIANELAVKFEQVRDDWLIVNDIQEGTLASWIKLVFDVAIKYCGEIE